MNQFGSNFRLSIYGESHGEAIGIVIDGVPSGISIHPDDFSEDIQRRKPGARGTTTRIEIDAPQLISGIYNGCSTGAPIHILFQNENVISKDYESIKNTPRPGHADFVAYKKYKGYNDPRGGGHFSGRLTLALVAAGVIAKKIITPIVVEAQVIEVGGMQDINTALEQAILENDSIGGIVSCSITNMPIGIGEPFFDSLESVISHLAFSIPAVKGIEFGSGFESARMKGSMHNDPIIDMKSGQTTSNNAGGINGGISNGNQINFRVAVKPSSSIAKKQSTINLNTGEKELIEIQGRHDACIALRVPVVLEAIAAIAAAELMPRNL